MGIMLGQGCFFYGTLSRMLGNILVGGVLRFMEEFYENGAAKCVNDCGHLVPSQLVPFLFLNEILFLIYV